MSENAVTRKPTDTEGVRRIIAKVKKHTLDRDNPHEVTAHQVGAYTQQETEDRINDALSGEVGSWLGNLTVAQVNALTTHRKGDSATMQDARGTQMRFTSTGSPSMVTSASSVTVMAMSGLE